MEKDEHVGPQSFVGLPYIADEVLSAQHAFNTTGLPSVLSL